MVARDDVGFEFMLNALRLTDGVPASFVRGAHRLSARDREPRARGGDAQGTARPPIRSGCRPPSSAAASRTISSSCSCPRSPPRSMRLRRDGSDRRWSDERRRIADGARAASRRGTLTALRSRRIAARSASHATDGADRRVGIARRVLRQGRRPARADDERLRGLAGRHRRRREGHHRHRRPSDVGRHADLRRPPSLRGRDVRRRGCARPARTCSARRSPPRSRTWIPSRTRNPVEQRALAGRLVVGIRRGGRRRPRARRRIGTQTNGSIIRPAAYCGVVGFKPTVGSISVAGVHPFAPTFDTVGTFARTVARRRARGERARRPRPHRARRRDAVAPPALRVARRSFPWVEPDYETLAGARAAPSTRLRDAAEIVPIAIPSAWKRCARPRIARSC